MRAGRGGEGVRKAIFVIGDSFTEAVGSTYEKSFAGLMACDAAQAEQGGLAPRRHVLQPGDLPSTRSRAAAGEARPRSPPRSSSSSTSPTSTTRPTSTGPRATSSIRSTRPSHPRTSPRPRRPHNWPFEAVPYRPVPREQFQHGAAGLRPLSDVDLQLSPSRSIARAPAGAFDPFADGETGASAGWSSPAPTSTSIVGDVPRVAMPHDPGGLSLARQRRRPATARASRSATGATGRQPAACASSMASCRSSRNPPTPRCAAIISKATCTSPRPATG